MTALGDTLLGTDDDPDACCASCNKSNVDTSNDTHRSTCVPGSKTQRLFCNLICYDQWLSQCCKWCGATSHTTLMQIKSCSGKGEEPFCNIQHMSKYRKWQKEQIQPR